jgi:hypothetical protein
LLLLSAHLHLEGVGILDVEAAFGHSNIQPAALQLRFDGWLDRLSVSQLASVYAM